MARLQQEFTARPSRVRFTLRLELTDLAGHRVIGTRELEAVEPAPSEDAAGGAAAANAGGRSGSSPTAAGWCAELGIDGAPLRSPLQEGEGAAPPPAPPPASRPRPCRLLPRGVLQGRMARPVRPGAHQALLEAPRAGIPKGALYLRGAVQPADCWSCARETPRLAPPDAEPSRWRSSPGTTGACCSSTTGGSAPGSPWAARSSRGDAAGGGEPRAPRGDRPHGALPGRPRRRRYAPGADRLRGAPGRQQGAAHELRLRRRRGDSRRPRTATSSTRSAGSPRPGWPRSTARPTSASWR